jgi:hypothetical protein
MSFHDVDDSDFGAVYSFFVLSTCAWVTWLCWTIIAKAAILTPLRFNAELRA